MLKEGQTTTNIDSNMHNEEECGKLFLDKNALEEEYIVYQSSAGSRNMHGEEEYTMPVHTEENAMAGLNRNTPEEEGENI